MYTFIYYIYLSWAVRTNLHRSRVLGFSLKIYMYNVFSIDVFITIKKKMTLYTPCIVVYIMSGIDHALLIEKSISETFSGCVRGWLNVKGQLGNKTAPKQKKKL